MVFKYKKWDVFCKRLFNAGLISIPACEVQHTKGRYIVLKHDVETNVRRALELAKIEHKRGHRGSYYVQAYLLNDRKNIDLLKSMKQMGHEISYHYDVMDSNKGNIDNALIEFENNRKRFENNGIKIVTVCQHGNPVIERIGYTSNRDFFRNPLVQEKYPDISDIMVDFKQKNHTDYTYYSDAGRRFCMIYDPINNDITNSDDKNIKYDNLDEVFETIVNDHASIIISTHPHRWTKTALEGAVKSGIFFVVKRTAKLFLLIPGTRRLLGRYYYLAKKI